MQWEGQELNTQLFSPSGSAQEVPVSNNLTLNLSSREDVTLVWTGCKPASFCISSGFAHKLAAERQWTQGLPPPPQRAAQPTTGVYTALISHITCGAGLRYSHTHHSDQQQLSSWEEVTCVKTEEQVLATEQSHKYLNAYPSRTLVM